MSVKFISKAELFLARKSVAFDAALGRMAADIEREAKMAAPHLTGDLVSSIRTKRLGIGRFIVEVGESPVVPYARRWEFAGENGQDVNVRFKKGKKSRYLRDAGIAIGARGMSYFKNAAATIAKI